MPRFSTLLLLWAFLCVLPFLTLAFYSHPALDDFSIGNALRTTSIWRYTWNTYFTHSGRFSSSLFSCIHLGIGHSIAWYSHLIAIFIGVFALSLYGAVAGLMPKDCAPASSVATSSAVLIMGFSSFPWPAEGFFWLTGVVAYLTPLIFTCWLVALMASIYSAPAGSSQQLKWIICILLGFLIPGFSEVTALISVLVVGAHLCFSSFLPAHKNVYWLIAALLFGSMLTLAAPGNFVRLHNEGEKIQAVRSVWLAAGATVYLLLNWAGNGLLLALTIIILPVSRAVARSPHANLLNRITNRKLLWPGLLFTGLFISILFCYLATNIGPALRVKNGLFFYFLACWFCTIHALVRHRNFETMIGPQPQSVQLCLGTVAFCLFLTDHNVSLRHDSISQASNTVVQAYRDLLSGDAARYDSAQSARYAFLKASATTNVGLPPLPVQPTTLFYYDISANAALWGNQAYAEFFGKKAIWVQPLVANP